MPFKNKAIFPLTKIFCKGLYYFLTTFSLNITTFYNFIIYKRERLESKGRDGGETPTLHQFFQNMRMKYSDGSRFWQRRGNSHNGGGANLLFWPISPKNCVEMKKNGRSWGGVYLWREHFVVFFMSRASPDQQINLFHIYFWNSKTISGGRNEVLTEVT